MFVHRELLLEASRPSAGFSFYTHHFILAVFQIKNVKKETSPFSIKHTPLENNVTLE